MSDKHSSDVKSALESTEEWIRYMEHRIAILAVRKQEWISKLEKLKRDKQEMERTLVEGSVSDWNAKCMGQMIHGLIQGS